MIASSYPNAPALASIFQVPTADQYSQNPQYWDAYKAEQARVTNDTPSAGGVALLQMYDALVESTLVLPRWGDPVMTGHNEAIWDAADWEWIYNPNSGHNKVY